MNAYAQYTIMEALPMPLTAVDQSSYSWFKFSHIEFLLNPRVSSLKLVEQGALIRLMAHAARQVPFGSLPNDPQLLAAMTCLTLPRWNKIADAVLDAAFVQCNDERWYCPLMIDELSPAQQDVEVKPAKAKKPVTSELSAKRAEAAAASHAKRKAKLQTDDASFANDDANLQSDIANFANDDLQICKTVANALQNGGIKGGDLDQDLELDSDLNQNLKNIRAASQHTKDVIAKNFDVFWTAYPKKTDRKKAFAAFTKINPSDDLLQTMLSGIAAWSSKWIAEPQYTPHPTTWLNGERWNDAPPPVSTAKPQNIPQKPLNAHSEIRQTRAELMRQSLDRPFVAEVNPS